MATYQPEEVTAADVEAARDDVRRGARGIVGGVVGIVAVAALGGGAIVDAIFASTDMWTVAIGTAIAAIAVGLPFIVFVTVFTKRRGFQIGLEKSIQQRMMQTEARRRDFDAQLGRALEMADNELAAFDVIQRGLGHAVPDLPAEVLLADNSHAHLERTVVSSPDGQSAPGCPVETPDRCIAARRAQALRFPDSEALDACPMLRGRERGRCSAVCVPVSIMGRTVGVVHATAPVEGAPDDESLATLQTLANQAGARLAMLRIMAETQLQASTDSLTGLLNRRSLENKVKVLRESDTPFSFAMADLDWFKVLNDTYGHDTGDRALRVFAETLQSSLRDHDLVCRHGGEEFAIVLPWCGAADGRTVLDHVRTRLAPALTSAGLPSFTVSIGVVEALPCEELATLVRRADSALFAAKSAGRDQVVVHDPDGNVLPVRERPGHTSADQRDQDHDQEADSPSEERPLHLAELADKPAS